MGNQESAFNSNFNNGFEYDEYINGGYGGSILYETLKNSNINISDIKEIDESNKIIINKFIDQTQPEISNYLLNKTLTEQTNANKINPLVIKALNNKAESDESIPNKSKPVNLRNESSTKSYPIHRTNSEKTEANSHDMIFSSSWSPASNNYQQENLSNTTSNSEPNSVTKKESYSSIYSYSFRKGMNFVGKFARGVKEFYNEINPATLTGAIDVIVVKQDDGSYRCSPFHVRFGKLGVLKAREKKVYIEINGVDVDLPMELGDAGEAYFMEMVNEDDESSTDTLVNNEYGNISNDKASLPSSISAMELSSMNEKSFGLKDSSERLKNESLPSSVTVSNFINIDKTNLTNQESGSTRSSLTLITSPPININNAKLLSVSPLVDDSIKSSSMSPANETISMEAEVKPINFFSDGELTPELTSPAVSRPPTPKSDTEIETQKVQKRKSISTDASAQWSWNWGQLPERQGLKPKNIATSLIENKIETHDENASKPKDPSSPSSRILGGVLNLIGNTNTTTSTNKIEGVYLGDTDKLDSEIAELYINQKSKASAQSAQQKQSVLNTSKDDDQESGKGQSCPQSPLRDSYSVLGDVQISLCGFTNSTNLQLSPNPTKTTTSISSNDISSSFASLNNPSSMSSSLLNTPSTSTQTISEVGNSAFSSQTPASYVNDLSSFEDRFQQYSVSFERFLEEIATITTNPNLVIKINGRYMNWACASPIILSAILYHKTLTTDVINNILDANMPKSSKPSQNSKNAANNTSGGGSWLGWGWGKKSLQAQNSAPNTPVINSTSMSALKTTNPEGIKQSAVIDTTTTITTTTTIEMKSRTSLNLEPSEAGMMLDEEMLNSQFKPYTSSSSSSVNFNTIISASPESKDLPFQNKKIKYRKTTRLSSEQIEKLNLKPGPNEIKFSVTTALQGTTRIVSYIFLWSYDDKIIVSDIDGTITKSDVWGQVLPIFGRDWSQAGVADLFTAIERNEYKFIYLSARAIGQSKITRDLLRSINQDGFKLPEGPLLVTPTSLFTAFQKEVIEKKPEEFKISCLKDIQSLFSNNPYYAGYGNKSTDVTAYKTVGIPVSRIFTINPQGEVKHETSRMFQSSYSKLCDYVDLIFPPFKASTLIKPDYDSFNYWRNPQPAAIMDEIEKELKEVLKKEAKVNPKDKKAKSQVPAIIYENDVETIKKKINEP